MRLRVDKARERPSGYYFRVTINCDLSEEEQSIEEFVYGKEMSLARIRQEFLAMLGNKYEALEEDILEFEGEEFEV